jgi:hypothetical protein
MIREDLEERQDKTDQEDRQDFTRILGAGRIILQYEGQRGHPRLQGPRTQGTLGTRGQTGLCGHKRSYRVSQTKRMDGI